MFVGRLKKYDKKKALKHFLFSKKLSKENSQTMLKPEKTHETWKPEQIFWFFLCLSVSAFQIADLFACFSAIIGHNLFHNMNNKKRFGSQLFVDLKSNRNLLLIFDEFCNYLSTRM